MSERRDQRVRIQKALADAGVASRRRAEQMVAAGRVMVNGVAATIGQQVDPRLDTVAVDGRTLPTGRERRIYLVLAKPQGVTSTVSDPHARRTVIDMVPAQLRADARRLYPVGRLDRDSEGLLLITNDGDWAQRMLHPSHGIERDYLVGVDLPVTAQAARQLEQGVRFEEGWATIARLSPATNAELRQLATLVGSDATRLSWYRVTLRQGMKRQIRRMFSAVGVPVRRLIRFRFGTLRLAGMSLGDVRPLTSAERRDLDGLAVQKSALVVSVDGPGGSGKSSVGAGAAKAVGYRFCDTGVLYRGLTWLALQRRVHPDDAAALEHLVTELELAPDVEQRYVHLMVEGREVTDELHTAEVDREVSRVSQHARVRARLLPVQRALASGGRIVMAGRDVGTVVLPDADLKVYLRVSVEERARRRATERGVGGDPTARAQIEDELRKRDEIDSTREAAPLRIPDGARVIDTDANTLDETVAQVVKAIRDREREISGDGR